MHLVIAVNTFAFLWSHRRGVVLEARARGFRVSVAAPRPRDERAREALLALQAAGVQTVELRSSRGTRSPGNLLAAVLELRRVFRELQPDVLHLVTPLMLVAGGFAAQLTRSGRVVSAVSGLGFLFSSRGRVGELRAIIGGLLLRLALRHPRHVVIVQNREDERRLRKLTGRDTRIELLLGSGVDLARYIPSTPPDGVPLVLLPSRMLRSKGVPEFIDAARILSTRGVKVRMVLCGEPDDANPDSMSLQSLERAGEDRTIEYIGFQRDMPRVLSTATIVCLPSTYAEGLPLCLAEAASAGRVVITTDTPGCRDTVLPGVTGSLIPPHDAVALADTIESLLSDRDLLLTMGHAARAFAEESFDVTSIIQSHIRIYESLSNDSSLMSHTYK